MVNNCSYNSWVRQPEDTLPTDRKKETTIRASVTHSRKIWNTTKKQPGNRLRRIREEHDPTVVPGIDQDESEETRRDKGRKKERDIRKRQRRYSRITRPITANTIARESKKHTPEHRDTSYYTCLCRHRSFHSDIVINHIQTHYWFSFFTRKLLQKYMNNSVCHIIFRVLLRSIS